MSKEIREKQKELQILINSKKELEKAYQESKRALEATITLEDAAQRCRNGEMTISEYKEFKDHWEVLDMVIRAHPEMKAATLESIQKSKDELDALKREQKKKLSSCALVVLLCVLLMTCGYWVCKYLF